MRCTFRVTAWNGAICAEHQDPHYGSKDSVGIMVVTKHILGCWDIFMRDEAAADAAKITRYEAKRVERAMHYEDFMCIRFSARDHKDGILFNVEVFNPNKCDGEVLVAANKVARSIAKTVTLSVRRIAEGCAAKGRPCVKFYCELNNRYFEAEKEEGGDDVIPCADAQADR